VALAAATDTDGLVDPTLGAALAEAGYDRDFAALPADGPRPSLPHPTAPEPSRWSGVRVDDAAGTVLVPTGCRLDLGATAKSQGADLAAATLSGRLGVGVLVSLGGDVAVAGSAPPGGWPVRTATSSAGTDRADAGETVLLSGGGLATSSPGARSWRAGGQPQHHIIDPSTARPAATAAVVLGKHAPGWLAGTALPARLVDDAGVVHRLNGWPEPGLWSR